MRRKDHLYRRRMRNPSLGGETTNPLTAKGGVESNFFVLLSSPKLPRLFTKGGFYNRINCASRNPNSNISNHAHHFGENERKKRCARVIRIGEQHDGDQPGPRNSDHLSGE